MKIIRIDKGNDCWMAKIDGQWIPTAWTLAMPVHIVIYKLKTRNPDYEIIVSPWL